MEKIWLKNYEPTVPHTIDPDQYANLNEMFEKCYADHHDHTCVVSFKTALTFKEVDGLSKNFAGYLQNELKLQKGARIAILMPNLLQYPIVMLAALRLGLIVVNVPFVFNADQIHAVLKKTEPEAIVFLENFSSTLQQALQGTSVKHAIVTKVGDLFPFFKRKIFHFIIRYIKKIPATQIPDVISFRKVLNEDYSEQFQTVKIDAHDTAFIFLTSARDDVVPKYVEITHRNYIALVLQVMAWCKPWLVAHQEETSLLLIPLFRAVGTGLFLCNMHYGFASILIADPMNVENIVAECKIRPFSYLVGVELLFERYLRDPAFCELDFQKLKLSLSGGVISANVITRWKLLTGTMLMKTYTVTESAAGVCFNNFVNKEYQETLGLPLPSMEIKICDLQGNELGVNQRGEIWLRGPNVMKGYWRSPELTQQVLTPEGWFKTGDIGVINEQGYVTLIERIADLIINEGHTISAIDIENVINSTKGVAESAVVSVKLESGKTLIKAFVVKKSPELTAEAILQTCQKHLMDYEIPHEIEFIDALPRTTVGFIMRRQLRERVLATVS